MKPSHEIKRRQVIVAGAPSVDWVLCPAIETSYPEAFFPVPGTTVLITELLQTMGLSVFPSRIGGNLSINHPKIPGSLFQCAEFTGAFRLSERIGEVRPTDPPRFASDSFNNADLY